MPPARIRRPAATCIMMTFAGIPITNAIRKNAPTSAIEMRLGMVMVKRSMAPAKAMTAGNTRKSGYSYIGLTVGAGRLAASAREAVCDQAEEACEGRVDHLKRADHRNADDRANHGIFDRRRAGVVLPKGFKALVHSLLPLAISDARFDRCGRGPCYATCVNELCLRREHAQRPA